MTQRAHVAVLSLIVAVGIAGITWLVWPSTVVVEHPAPAARQEDGSLVLPREASGPITPMRKPAQAVPKKTKVERIVQVAVAPTQPPAGQPCPPVTVDLTLVREPDGSRRVVASSPDGQVISGRDIPIETPAERPDYRWAAGLSLDPIHQTPGVWVDRTWRRLRVGVEANQVAIKGGGTGGEIRVRLGWVF